MDYLGLLNDNSSKIFSRSKKIRDFIEKIVDEHSFVETDVFMSGSDSLEEAPGEGVVTGFASIKDFPICIIAQNIDVLGGSVGKAHAQKILKCINRCIETATPLISIIDSNGARLGEGLGVLEGYSEIIAAATQLKNYAPHIAVIKGNAIGLMGMYAVSADFLFFGKNSVLSANPPLTLSNSATFSPQGILGKEPYLKNSLLSGMTYEKPEEIAHGISKLLHYLWDSVIESDDDPNRTADILNTVANSQNLLEALADKDRTIEMFSEYTEDIKTYFATINSIPVGLMITNSKRLNEKSIRKATAFVDMLDRYGLPLVSLVDSQGLESNLEKEQQGLITTAYELMASVSTSEIPKIAVITEYAIGYAYSALCSKATGFDYVLAFANAKAAPISSDAAASIIYGMELGKKGDPVEVRQELAERYRKNEMNPFVSAKEGYIDNIIEPALLRPYVTSGLMMLLRRG